MLFDSEIGKEKLPQRKVILLTQIRENGATLAGPITGEGFLIRRCTKAGNPDDQAMCNGYQRRRTV